MEQAIFAFLVDGTPVTCAPHGGGHINYTFKVTTDTGKEYILQKVNQYVFKDPKSLMENVGAVVAFMKERVEDPRSYLHFMKTKDDLYYHVDADGEYWRCYEYVGGFCLEAPETLADFYESALAFGKFQEMLSEFPAETLHETIPEFHNTIDRYRIFKKALADNASGRADTCAAEIDFIMAREEEAGTLQRMRESGELPLRVTHNDTKLNNVLLDLDTRKALCVLDLDTVMPGLSLYDYGDSIRFGAATAAEDETDLSKMTMDLDRFEIYTKGYLEACPSLTAKEIEMMPMGAKIITLELASRFLADYLDGDRYFKVAYPEHNLVRARTQLKLVADMEAKWDQMQAIVAKLSK